MDSSGRSEIRAWSACLKLLKCFKPIEIPIALTYLAFSTVLSVYSFKNTIHINSNILLLDSRSVQLSNKEKQKTAKDFNSSSKNLTCLFKPLVKRCIVWLQHDARNDLNNSNEDVDVVQSLAYLNILLA